MQPAEVSRLGMLGFEYYSFISYPNTDPEVKRLADRFQGALERLLAREVPHLLPPFKGKDERNYVFFDTRLHPGDDWERTLGEAICKSVTMIALCLPMYAHEDHQWCGREWKAMEILARQRLRNGASPIFAVKLGKLDLPSEISHLQVVDLSCRVLRRLDRTRHFDDCLGEALRHIFRICRLYLADMEAQRQLFEGSGEIPGWSPQRYCCGDFRLPQESAFSKGPVPPLVSRGL